MDRSTVIQLDRAGVRYTNGVRHTVLAWDEIQAVRVLSAPWGARQVQVIGETAGGKLHFEFRTLGTVNYQRQVRGHTGFADGKQILETICSWQTCSLFLPIPLLIRIMPASKNDCGEFWDALTMRAFFINQRKILLNTKNTKKETRRNTKIFVFLCVSRR